MQMFGSKTHSFSHIVKVIVAILRVRVRRAGRIPLACCCFGPSSRVRYHPYSVALPAQHESVLGRTKYNGSGDAMAECRFSKLQGSPSDEALCLEQLC